MSQKRYVAMVAVFSLACWIVGFCPANASVIAPYLTFDGVVDSLTDESRTAFFDADSSGGFNDDDILFGIIRVSNIDASGVGDQAVNDQVAVVFSAMISGGTGTNADPFNLVPVAPGNAHSLPSLLDDSVQNGFTDADSIWDTAIAIVLGNLSTALTDNPLNFTDTTPEGAIGQFVGPGWIYEALLGFDVTGTNSYGDADFFEATASVVGDTITGNEAAGFTVLDSAFGATFNAVSALHTDGLNANRTDHDATLVFPDTTYTNNFSGQPNNADWDFRDQSFMQLNVSAVPEPMSIAVWIVLATVFGWHVSRRRSLC